MQLNLKPQNSYDDPVEQDRQVRRFSPMQTDQDIRDAEAKGYEVIYGEPTDLLLDLDTPEDEKLAETHSQILRRVVPDLAVWQGEEWASRSGNKHWRLRFKAGVYLDPLERLLLEVCLGGDRKRALFSYTRLRQGVEARKCSLLWKPRVSVTAREEQALKATSAEPAPFVLEDLLEMEAR